MKQKYLTGTLKLVYAAVCLSLCLVLPFLTGQIPEIGSKLSPMHLPVLLCGFLCGWQYGLAVGAVAAPLRFLLFTMPPFPNCLFMAFELAAYGLMTGLFYKAFPKKSRIHLRQSDSFHADRTHCLGRCAVCPDGTYKHDVFVPAVSQQRIS